MDYALKIWWEDLDVVRDAIRNGDPRPVEATLQRCRDRVVAAGGVCYIDTAAMDDAPVAERLLATATIATVGELFLEIGDGGGWDDDYRRGLRQLLHARRTYPALCAAVLGLCWQRLTTAVCTSSCGKQKARRRCSSS